jgi:hypothetical protein
MTEIYDEKNSIVSSEAEEEVEKMAEEQTK